MIVPDTISGMAVEVEKPATSMRDEFVRTLLIEAVRLRVHRLKRAGGPDPRQSASLVKQLGAEPLNNGNAMKTAQQFNLLAESLAHLSFAPGGCRAFGLRFEASPRPSERDEHPAPRSLLKQEAISLEPTKSSQQHWQGVQEAERTVLPGPTNKREEKPEQRKETSARQMRLFSTEEY
jgi:hypothetical protein